MGDWMQLLDLIPTYRTAFLAIPEEDFEKSAKLKHINSFTLEERKLCETKEAEIREIRMLLRNDLKCSICINMLVKPITLECGHT